MITSLDTLGKLSKDELWQAALNKQNSETIQEIALYKWMALDDREHVERFARMRTLLRQSWELVRRASTERAGI